MNGVTQPLFYKTRIEKLLYNPMFSIELKYALQIVSDLERARLAGERADTPDLRRCYGSEITTFNNVMLRLTRSGWVNGDNTLLVDLNGKSLFDLAEAIGDPAVNEHDYMYGWSPDNLSVAGAAVDISKTLNEEYRNRLSAMPLTALMTGLSGAARKRMVRKHLKFERICPRRKGAVEL